MTRVTRRGVLSASLAAALSAKTRVTKASEREIDPEFPPFEKKFMFAHEEISHPVLYDGDGPGVILMHELPGMVPEFWRLAGWLREAGFTVYTPDLYADTLAAAPTPPSLRGNLYRVCMSREIYVLSSHESSPVTVWLRALARHVKRKTDGAGIGVIGLCLTGNFALSLVIEEDVIAPVTAEPSLPLMFSGDAQAALHLSEDEREALRERTDIDIMALRFDGDPVCRKARFDSLEDLVGPERLTRIELPDAAANPDGNPYPHAVLTRDLIDEEGSLTLAARDRVIAFLTDRLLPVR